jgi:hypothetical protein
VHTVRFESNAFTNTYYKASNGSGISLRLPNFFLICFMAVTAIMTCLMPLLTSFKTQIKKMAFGLDRRPWPDGVQIDLGFMASSVTPGWISGLQDLLA